MSFKICYITTIPWSFSNFILDSAQYNYEQGKWDITVISSYDKEFEKMLPQNIHYISVNMSRGYTLKDIHTIKILSSIFRKEKYDLVEYATTKAALYASIASKIAGIPVRLYGQWGISYSTYTGVKRFVVTSIEKTICSLSTNVYGVCEENLERAIKDGLYSKEKGFVIGKGSSLGVSLERFDISRKNDWRKEIRLKYSIPDEAFVYGYVGMMRKEKGLDELFGAAYSILQKHEDAWFLIVGNNHCIEGIDDQKMEWAENEKHVVFTGMAQDVEKYFSALDCFVFPSYHEGFGNVTIEAEAMGIPIIATDIPGTRTAMMNGVTGEMVPSMNEEALEICMEKFYRNTALLEAYSVSGRDYVDKYFNRKKMCEWIYSNRKRLMEES